ncbi:MAG TPA: hypothetical protein VKY74_22050, partial [Chloroflexia bacterium]|nr:hypothetical protein [Chloroflexia bacterium]
MDGPEVWIDLYPEAQRGTYAVEVQAGPPGRATAADLPAQSADLWLAAAPAQPGSHRLTFTPLVPGP